MRSTKVRFDGDELLICVRVSGCAWVPVEVAWEKGVGWFFRINREATRFKSACYAEEIAEKVSVNCDVPVALVFVKSLEGINEVVRPMHRQADLGWRFGIRDVCRSGAAVH